MKNDGASAGRVFSRRAVLLGAAQGVLLSSLAARLYYLQVIEADRYTMLAEENRINLRLLPPPRGAIMDRDGKALAVNRQNYRAVIVRERANDVEATLAAFGAVVALGPKERQRILREIGRKRSFVPVTLRENLTWDEVARIEINSPDLPGVSIEMGQTRFYPYGPSAVHVLGYVAAVSEKELTGDPLLELPGFHVGKSGIEKVHDLALRGKAGSSQLEVNAVGRVIRELSRDDGNPGAEVSLTLDIGLQELAVERLTGEAGAAVVIDVENGEILALASAPVFDPQVFTQGLSTEAWQALIKDPRAPLSNKAIAGQYAPGSTFKMVVALAALEAGVATPDTTQFCTGELEFGNTTFHCWKRGGHGSVDMATSIEQSCDIYFYEMARRVGVDRISAMARRFGLGTVLDIDLPGEKSGLMPTRAWKHATTGVPWQQGETLIIGIGQGFILATPLQLAVMSARFASGRAVTPHITRDVRASTATGGDVAGVEEARLAPSFPPLAVSASGLEVVRAAMDRVVNSPRGTAAASRLAGSDLMAGKTGTSQVRRIGASERLSGVRKNADRDWIERDHALFVGFAPTDKPRYAVAVIVEHGGSGSAVAAPVARDLLQAALKRDRAKGSIAGGGDAGRQG